MSHASCADYEFSTAERSAAPPDDARVILSDLFVDPRSRVPTSPTETPMMRPGLHLIAWAGPLIIAIVAAALALAAQAY